MALATMALLFYLHWNNTIVPHCATLCTASSIITVVYCTCISCSTHAHMHTHTHTHPFVKHLPSPQPRMEGLRSRMGRSFGGRYSLHQRIVHTRTLVLFGRGYPENTSGLLTQYGHLYTLGQALSLCPDDVPQSHDGGVAAVVAV